MLLVITSFKYWKIALQSSLEHVKDIAYEIIVVDNASNEGDVSKITSKFSDVRLLRNSENLGFAKANNLGAQIAHGDYLLFLNNDTMFIENSLKKVYDFVKSKKEEIIAGIKLLNQDHTMQESVYEATTVWNSFTENFFLYKIFPRSKSFNKYYQNHINLESPVETGVVKGAFLFISQKSFNRLNGFDERFFFFGEELDLCYRFHKEIGKVIYFPLTSIIHLGGATTGKNLLFKYRNQTIAKIQFFQKHFKGLKFLLGICFHFLGLIFRFPLYLLAGIFSFRKTLLN